VNPAPIGQVPAAQDLSSNRRSYSGGYVIHLAAGTSGFVAAAVIGPRLARDRARAVPNNLPMAAVGAGILWLGWNGFNGGDPYFAGADASTAVLNTNLATATALLTWLLMDMFFSPQRKPTFLGAINGMICGLVGITPAAGLVNGFGALLIGLITSAVVWLSWNKLARIRLFQTVDDTLGVVHTHGVAGLTGGLLVGLLADPNVVEYLNKDGSTGFSAAGLFYGNPKQLAVQAGAALTVIVWDALITFLILKSWDCSRSCACPTRTSRSVTWPRTRKRPTPTTPWSPLTRARAGRRPAHPRRAPTSNQAPADPGHLRIGGVAEGGVGETHHRGDPAGGPSRRSGKRSRCSVYVV
jgi:ammonia channel protein AmtB